MDEAQIPLRVAVTGAAGQLAYSLLYQIASGYTFGHNRRLILQLLDVTPAMTALHGVVMELQDCSLPLVAQIVATDDPTVAFKDADAALLVASCFIPHRKERRELLPANVKIFKEQGQALDSYAKRDVKVLVVANPANTMALICAKYAPSLPRENFTALTCLDQNRAHAQLALRAGVSVSQVRNVIIWGNHSATQVADVSHATIAGRLVVQHGSIDEEWLHGPFLSTVQRRSSSVMAARKRNSAMSAAKAASDHMRSWFNGTEHGQHMSMGVYSDGTLYDAPAGVIFSMPCYVDGATRKWRVVPDLSRDEFIASKMVASAQELVEERDEALRLCTEMDSQPENVN